MKPRQPTDNRRQVEVDIDISDKAVAKHLGCPLWVAKALREEFERTARQRETGDDRYPTV